MIGSWFKVFTTVFTVLSFVFGLISTAQAAQLQFKKSKIDTTHQFFYQWRDFDKQTHQLNFTMNNSDIFRPFRHFRTYRPRLASNFIQQSIKQSLSRQPISGVQVVFNNQGAVNLRGRNPDDIQQASLRIKELETTFRQQYLKQNHYALFQDANGETGIKPDHVKFALESVPFLTALIEPLRDELANQDIRRIANYVLSFVQSIPYSTLESRLSSSGSGFAPPTMLLYQNQGDCDSKVTLTAAILKSLLPKLDLAIIYIPQHALIGIQAAYVDDEKHLTIEGIDYVLAEPTGPALMKMGKIANNSLDMIERGQYVAERFVY